VKVSRRGFLQGTAATAAGLVIGFHIPSKARAQPKPPGPPQPNAFLRIGTDDSVTVILAHSEMGQGNWTGLAMLIAEELECDWSKVRSEHAPAAPAYAHLMWGRQGTGGSTGMYSEFDRYRTVGAQARDMLIRAAAARWKVAPATCRAANGVVTSGKSSARFGELAADAMKLAPPAKVKLKSPKEWKLIGTKVRRLDSPEKVTGKAQFGIDVSFPGLRTAVVARPPAFGSKLVKFDPAAALRVPGVEQVVPAGNGVAVVAKHFWAAKLGRDALLVEWSKPDGGGLDTARQLAEARELAQRPGAVALDQGKVDAAIAKAKRRFTAEYEFPYLAHAPMEPLGATVKIDGDRVEVWASTQSQGGDQMAAAAIAGTTPDKVTLHTPFLGGGFGRRASMAADFVAEAVLIAKAAKVPIKTVWTREDDIRGGYYRPSYFHRVQVGVDGTGFPVAWDHVVVGQSIGAGTPAEKLFVHNGVDHTSIEGLVASPYLQKATDRRVTLHTTKTPVPVLWWRSVGNTHTAFALECMVDELAHAAGKDPLEYRLALLKGAPRHAAALKLAAEKAGWGKPPPAGRARGLAVHESFGSIVAEVAEVSVDAGRIRVHEVTCVLDCGTAVNPLAVEAQMQGGIVYGLSAALHGKLTLKGGAVQEGNFHDYPVLRMFEMPKVSVHIIPSGAKMGGVGEPATPVIAPAVANAVYALTKQRLRSLPLRLP